MNETLLMLVAAECKCAVENADGLEAKLRAAMDKAKDHWMVRDPDLQLRGAIAAVLMHYGKESPEHARIVAELDGMRKLSAIMQAAQAGLSVKLTEADVPTHKPIGIAKMWAEATA